jgi:hypothetical protein
MLHFADRNAVGILWETDCRQQRCGVDGCNKPLYIQTLRPALVPGSHNAREAFRNVLCNTECNQVSFYSTPKALKTASCGVE